MLRDMYSMVVRHRELQCISHIS